MAYVRIESISRENLLISADERWRVDRRDAARPRPGAGAPARPPDAGDRPRGRHRRRATAEAVAPAEISRRQARPRRAVLAGEPIPVPTRGAAADAPEAVRRAGGGRRRRRRHPHPRGVENGSVEPGSLFTASLSRNQAAVRTGAIPSRPGARSGVARRRAGGQPVRARAAADAARRRQQRRAARRARRLARRPLPRLRLVARGRRGRRRASHAALLVLLDRVGAAGLRLHLLR